MVDSCPSPVAPLSVTVSVSFPSTALSFVTFSATALFVSPALKLSLPAPAVKSVPLVAVPFVLVR